MNRRCTLPRPVTLFHMPEPSFTTVAFSVCRNPANNGAADGSCLTTAFRYWSSDGFKHARSHCAAAAEILCDATKAQIRQTTRHASFRDINCLLGAAGRIGENRAATQ